MWDSERVRLCLRVREMERVRYSERVRHPGGLLSIGSAHSTPGLLKAWEDLESGSLKNSRNYLETHVKGVMRVGVDL